MLSLPLAYFGIVFRRVVKQTKNNRLLQKKGDPIKKRSRAKIIIFSQVLNCESLAHTQTHVRACEMTYLCA